MLYCLAIKQAYQVCPTYYKIVFCNIVSYKMIFLEIHIPDKAIWNTSSAEYSKGKALTHYTAS